MENHDQAGTLNLFLESLGHWKQPDDDAALPPQVDMNEWQWLFDIGQHIAPQLNAPLQIENEEDESNSEEVEDIIEGILQDIEEGNFEEEDLEEEESEEEESEEEDLEEEDLEEEEVEEGQLRQEHVRRRRVRCQQRGRRLRRRSQSIEEVNSSRCSAKIWRPF